MELLQKVGRFRSLCNMRPSYYCMLWSQTDISLTRYATSVNSELQCDPTAELMHPE